MGQLIIILFLILNISVCVYVYIYIYIGTNFINFFTKNYTLPLLTISLIILKIMLQPQTFFTIFLKIIIDVVNSYQFAFRPTTCINFLITNNHSLHQQFVKKIVVLAFFFTYRPLKKFIDLKFKTKYTTQKKLIQQKKLPIAKLKQIKSNSPIFPKTNNLNL